MKIQEHIFKKIKKGQKLFSVLIDPGKSKDNYLKKTIKECHSAGVDIILVGGSIASAEDVSEAICIIKDNCDIPVVLFPGSPLQLSPKADALFLLSLISGRNPELLIGQHVIAAPVIKAYKIETIPTGYMLIENGKITSVSYISNTMPIPADKPELAAYTALAGQQLGLKQIYLEAGSGANKPVSIDMIKRVKETISIPLIVGGGIRDAKTAFECATAGADMIVVGNAIEKNNTLIDKMSEAIHKI